MNATMKINTYLCTVFKNKQQNTIAKRAQKDLGKRTEEEKYNLFI